MENQHNFESLKSQIRDRESQRAAIVNQYEASLAKIDQAIVKLKVELANLVLSGQAETEENDGLITLVGIRFNEGGKVYDYFWDSDAPVMAGDRIEVEGRCGGNIPVIVQDVKRLKVDLAEMSKYKNAYPLGAY